MRPGHHAIFVALTTGALVLSFLVLTIRFWLRPRDGEPPASSVGPARALWRACDGVGLYAALFGLAMLVLAAISGFLARPTEALLNSPITKNKILTTYLSTLCWAAWIAIRLKAGPRLWDQRTFASHFAYVLVLAGFLWLVTTNSIGGDLSGIPSGYEQLAEAIGYRTRHALYFPTWLNILLWIAGLAALAAAVLARRRRRSGPSGA